MTDMEITDKGTRAEKERQRRAMPRKCENCGHVQGPSADNAWQKHYVLAEFAKRVRGNPGKWHLYPSNLTLASAHNRKHLINNNRANLFRHPGFRAYVENGELWVKFFPNWIMSEEELNEPLDADSRKLIPGPRGRVQSNADVLAAAKSSSASTGAGGTVGEQRVNVLSANSEHTTNNPVAEALAQRDFASSRADR